MNVMQEHVKEKDGHLIFDMDRAIPGEYFKAVIFTCKMLYKGMPFDFAINKASDKYRIDQAYLIYYLPDYVKKLL